MSASTDQNRQTATAFYEMMFNDCDPRRAVELFVAADYTQHNPNVADGKKGFIEYFERMAREYPRKTVSIKRTVCEGNYLSCTAIRFGRVASNTPILISSGSTAMARS